jgi:hypothetical protein
MQIQRVAARPGGIVGTEIAPKHGTQRVCQLFERVHQLLGGLVTLIGR